MDIEREMSLDKGKVVMVVAVAVALASVGLFAGMVNSFQNKIDYLSDRYEIYECKIRWVDYPAEQNRYAISMGYDYEVLEASSWTAFKSLIKQKIHEGSLVGNLFYEYENRVIWFNTLEWIDFGRYRLTVYYIKG